MTKQRFSARFFASFFAAFLLGATAFASDGAAFDPSAPGPATPETFATPPASVRPWAYYWQLKGNNSKEQVTKDLEALASKGFGGVLVFDSRRYWDDYASTTHVPVPLEIKNEFMSNEWRDVMKHLVSEAARLGMQVSFNISDSGGQLRGPWDSKELGPRELVWTEGNINGPKAIDVELSTPAGKEYFADVALLAVRITSPVNLEGRETVVLNETWGRVSYPDANAPTYDQVVDLQEFAKDGRLKWNVPDGAWKILRFATERIGEPGAVDILNAKSTEDYFRKMPETLMNDVGPLAGKTLTYFYNVSWEGVHPNWTDGFADFFASRRQYDVETYLPILRGLRPNGDAGDFETADRFVVDYLKTVGDAFRINCYQTIGRLCAERGVRWHSEDGGPWNRQSPLFRESDMLTFWGQNDFPQGEFWIDGGRFRQTNAAYAAMAAHIYGRRDVALEAFTHMNRHWTVYPALLKPYADKNYVDGANFFIWHTFTSSPEELGKPGFEYFAGSHVNANVTWFPWVGPFVDYLARCQLLLRQGVNVADVCVYASDSNYVTWGRAKEWREKSELVPPQGFKFDLIDTPSLVERLEYRDGKLVLPGGASYRLLVVDPATESVPAEALSKIAELARQGAPILLGAIQPQKSRGLTNRETADATVAETARELWANDKLRSGATVAETLEKLGVKPDFEGPFEYVRRSDADRDYYFVVGSGRADCVFRVSGKSAEIWNPVDGTVESVETCETPDGRTRVALDLPPNGAAFVVFSSKPSTAPRRVEKTFAPLKTLDGPWNVAFDPNWGGPESVVFERLKRWDESDDPRIKHYSGTAVYSLDFELTDAEAAAATRLSLGEVANIAEVKLNGRSLGVAWTAPWEVSLQDAARPGKNRLEILTTNCWANRLIGDAQLPPEERFTKTNVVLEKAGVKIPAYRGFAADSPLLPSGLIGPATLLKEETR